MQSIHHFFITYRRAVIVTVLAVVALVVGTSVPPVRAQVGVLREAVFGAPAPVTIVASSPDTAQLEERLLLLEDQVKGMASSTAAATQQVKVLQEDYQKAVAELAATHDALVKESGRLQVASKQSPGIELPVSAQPKSTKVSLNHGTAADFDSLPGIGPAYAERIVTYRTQHGSFTSVDELGNVPGIGPATIDKIRDLVEL